MQTDHASFRLDVVRAVSEAWKKWQKRRARLAEFDRSDSVEKQHIARDLGTSVSELRILAGQDENAADLLLRRLRDLNVDPAKVEPAVMRDLQRCCSQCGDKTLCEHELEDRPKLATWPKYCPNEQTIEALVAERSLDRGRAFDARRKASDGKDARRALQIPDLGSRQGTCRPQAVQHGNRYRRLLLRPPKPLAARLKRKHQSLAAPVLPPRALISRRTPRPT